MKILTLLTMIIATIAKRLWLNRCLRPVCIVGLVLFFIGLNGCKKDSSNAPTHTPANAPPGSTVLAAGVVRVDSVVTLNSALVAVDSVSVTFKDVAASEKLQVGNILSGKMSSIAPYGFLRKITSISTSGGLVVCQTMMARLSDAVVNTQVSETISSDALFRTLPDATSVATPPNPLAKNFASISVGVTRSIPFDHDFGVVTVKGDIEISGMLTLALTMSGAKVTSFKADFETIKTISITASNGQSYSGNLSFTLPPIELPPIEMDAGVPVTFEAQLLLEVGFNCNLSEKISASVTNNATDEIGESYSSGQWQPINTHTDKINYQYPKLTASAKVEPYAKLTLRLIPFGITDLAISGNVDLTAKASAPFTASLSNKTISASGEFDLDFGLDADLRSLDIFNLKYNYDWATIKVPFYSETYTIGSGSGGSTGTGGTGGTGTGGTGTGGTGTGGTGSGTMGQLVIQGGTSTSFGNVPVNSSATITLPLVNEGGKAITVSSISTNAPFSVSPTSITVPADGTVNLTLTFAPTSTGYFNSPITIYSNASNPTVTYETDGTGTPAGSSGGPGQRGNINGATAVPAIGSFTDCLAVQQNSSCNSFTDGVVHARVVSVDEVNKTITFEVANCKGSAFAHPSTLYVYKGLCGGTEVGGVSFPATVYSYQITVNEPNMVGTKSYNIIVQQTVNGQFVSYDAAPISITF